MIRSLVAVLVTLALSATSLAAQDAADRSIPRTQNELPTWLLERLRSPAHVASTGTPMVTIYRYRDQVAFYIPPRCCDIMSELYNELGILICRPGGGIGGQGDNRCPDFRQEAERLAVVTLD